jgi:hypothetical protein
MVQTGVPGLESLLENICQGEARKLHPQLVLFDALAAFKDKHQPRLTSKDATCEARRNFLDPFRVHVGWAGRLSWLLRCKNYHVAIFFLYLAAKSDDGIGQREMCRGTWIKVFGQHVF